MNAIVLWATAAAGLLVGELVTGTFYLAIFAGGAAVAAVLAWLGVPWTGQLLGFSLLASAGGLWLHRRRKPKEALYQPPLGFALVQEVRANGQLRVSYRGSTWDAVVKHGEAQVGQTLQVDEMDANRLVLTPAS